MTVISLSRLSRSMIVAAASLCAAGATAQDTPRLDNSREAGWSSTVAETDGGHLIGNPEAAGKLVEFISYTCSHCAHFARTGEGAIRLLYVPTGKISFEVRNLIRNPIDMVAALTAQCGKAENFFGNHEAIMLKHPEWMAKLQKANQAQIARWQHGSNGSRARAIANDLDFYEIMERRGYSRSELDQCLTDEAKFEAIAEQSDADVTRYGLTGTPTFLMGDEKLDAHDWRSLQPHLDKYFR